MSKPLIGLTEDDVIAIIGRQTIQIAALQGMVKNAESENAKLILENNSLKEVKTKTEG